MNFQSAYIWNRKYSLQSIFVWHHCNFNNRSINTKYTSTHQMSKYFADHSCRKPLVEVVFCLNKYFMIFFPKSVTEYTPIQPNIGRYTNVQVLQRNLGQINFIDCRL